MIEIPLQDVQLADVIALRDLVQRETHTHEFKGRLDFRSDKHKTMIATQVGSFANAEGGDLTLGVPEGRGVIGLEGDPDVIELKIRQIAQHRLAPKPPTLQILTIEADLDRYVYVVRVARSWTAPHMLTQENRFYARDGNGKRLMDRFEIERAFAEASGRTDTIRAFRRARLDALRVSGKLLFLGQRIMVTHVVPMQPTSLPVSESAFRERFRQVCFGGRPVFEQTRTTIDGLQLWDSLGDDPETMTGRAIVFRNGRLEYAWALGSRMSILNAEGILTVTLPCIQRDLEESLRNLIGGLVDYGVETPICIMPTLIGVKGAASQARCAGHHFHESQLPKHTCDRDELLLPAITIEGDLWAEYQNVIAQVCTILWQCFGEEWPGGTVLPA